MSWMVYTLVYLEKEAVVSRIDDTGRLLLNKLGVNIEMC
jgi:hypothetical protein